MRLNTIQFLYIITVAAVISAFEGNAQNTIGDDGLATAAVLEFPSGLAIDRTGNVYIAERRGNRIRKVDTRTGLIRTIAGTGKSGYSGDGEQAAKADISHPELIAVDSKGNIIIADRSNSRVRKIDRRSGIISTVAGTGEAGYTGDGTLSTDAKISYPFGVLLDRNDNIFIADTENHVIRKIDAKTSVITTLAGNGKSGFSGDGGLALHASLNRPHNGVFDDKGNLIIGDSENQRIRVVDLNTNKIKTLYGAGREGLSEDGSNAANAAFGYFGSFVMYDNKLFFSEIISKRIRIIDIRSGKLSSLTDANGIPVRIDGPYGMTIDDNGNLYVAESNKNRILKINIKSGEVVRFAGK